MHVPFLRTDDPAGTKYIVRVWLFGRCLMTLTFIAEEE